ncbi:MAG: spore coat protein CotH [Cytophagaceae bacterium]|nr:MAG: spore coat protein CotH [Cytophagaceae bacterium]
MKIALSLRLPLVIPALIYLLTVSVTSFSQQIYINEIMASNAQTFSDETNAFEDWFELYNPNAVPVDIAGYYVTDNLSIPTKYQFPTGSAQTIIPANGYLVIWASQVPTRGPLHVGFKLSAEGEAIGLFMPDGSTPVDQVTFGPQRTDISWGRKPDGTTNWLFFQRTSTVNDTSPGTSNEGHTGYTEVLDVPVFSQPGGFYSSAFSLSITSPDPAVTIYYTLDGSAPNPADLGVNTFIYKNSYVELPGQTDGALLTESYQTFAYTDAIPIADRSSEPNRVSLKSSSYNFGPYYFPASPLFKGTVVRAVAYKDNALVSHVSTQTYFVTPNVARYTIPVVSIGADERSFFDYNTGFYTAGASFDAWRSANPTVPAEGICVDGNYSFKEDSWRRAGNVEFMVNGSSVLNQRVDLAINGGCSRSVPRKSLRLYGNSNFAYPFFNNRPSTQFYDRLLLRNSGNDWNYTLLIDSYMQRLVNHLKFDTQSNRPSVVFLNGEYWGVHTLMERYDANYLNRNYNVSTDSVDVIKAQYVYTADDGDLTQLNQLLTHFNLSDPVNYSYVKTQIDLESLADYQLAAIFSGNSDWPLNNQQLWRKRTSQYLPNAPYGHDGRFRWMMNDMDLSLGFQTDYLDNTLARATNSEAGDFTLFFRKMLDVPDFKTYFINRAADLLNTTFDPSRTTSLLTSMRQEYEPYMGEHFSRWNTGNSVELWQSLVNVVNNFVTLRPTIVRDHIKSTFGLASTQNLVVSVSDTAQGYVNVNTIEIRPTTVGVSANPYPWSGVYFEGVPVRLVAKPKVGYRFVGWQEEGTIIATDTAYSYTPASDRVLIAIFDVLEVYVAKPLPFTLTSGDYRFENWSSTATAGTYPPNMYFVGLNQADPTLTATFALADTLKGVYNLTSGTRINGLNANGISLINTGGGNPGYPASALGGIVLALRTTGVNVAYVQWTGGTVTPNPRQYRIRLRYRVGDTGVFQDFLDGNNNPVEYLRNSLAGHSQVIGPVMLPATLLDKPYIQLLWQYYYTGVGTSGARDQLRLDNVIISRDYCQSLLSGDWNSAATWSCGRVPNVLDNVVIADGHTVTIPISSARAKSLTVGNAAQIRYTIETASLRISP